VARPSTRTPPTNKSRQTQNSGTLLDRGMEEPIVPLPDTRERIPLVRQVRSTLLSSSLQSIRDHGAADQYFERLPREHHDAILSLVAGVWVPVELAIVHYATCDTLELDATTSEAISTDVAQRIHGSLLATVIRMATGTGVTMMTGLQQVQRLYTRVFMGGGIGAYQLGPKEARIDFAGFQLASISYFRNGLRNTTKASLELFARTLYMREIPERTTARTVSYRLSWV